MSNDQGESLLHASRRLDWRFLLPNPTLGHVGYVGHDQGMLGSLRAFAGRVTQIDSESAAAPNLNGGCDVLVLTTPSPAMLQRARSLVREGGYLYVEVDRRLARRAVRSPDACGRVLRDAGFDDIRTYCPWTTFETSTAFVPLEHPGAAAYFLSRHEQGLAARVRAAAAWMAVRSGALPTALGRFSIAATRARP